MVELDTEQTKNSNLFWMATLSPKVAESLELELYRSKADSDGATTDYILEDAFTKLMQDIDIIGLSFDLDMGDYVDDMTKLNIFLQLVSLLLPNGLYPALKADTKLRETIEHIFQGSLGDGGSAIQTYLTEIGGLDGGIPLRPSLTDFVDNIYLSVGQTGVFTDYLRNLLELFHDERPSAITDEERLSRYRDVMRDKIGLLSDAINLFDDQAEYDEMCRIQNILIRDLLAPDNFIPYAYLFLEHPDALPEELHAGYAARWYHYKVSHPWCADYYHIRGGEVPRPYQYAIACVLFMLSDSKQTYLSQIAPFRVLYPNPIADQKITALYQE